MREDLDLLRSLSEAVQEARDRQAIIDCLHRYCRGLDRLDEELMMSVFHEDAVQSNGALTSQGSPREFFDWYRSQQTTRWGCLHYVTNVTIELDGDVAHVESYGFATVRDARQAVNTGGRYIDRFERRNGDWRIAARVGTLEWIATEDGAEMERRLTGSVSGSRDRRDPSYDRPLTPRPHSS